MKISATLLCMTLQCMYRTGSSQTTSLLPSQLHHLPQFMMSSPIVGYTTSHTWLCHLPQFVMLPHLAMPLAIFGYTDYIFSQLHHLSQLLRLSAIVMPPAIVGYAIFHSCSKRKIWLPLSFEKLRDESVFPSVHNRKGSWARLSLSPTMAQT